MEEDQKKPVGKARLDGDDILPSDLLAKDGEKNKTSDEQGGSPEEKVRLDFEGVLEEEISQELEVSAQVHAAAEEKKESKQTQERIPAQRFSFFDLSPLKRLPLVKIGLIGGGILVLVVGGWFVADLLLHSEPDTIDGGAEEGQTELVEGSEYREEFPDNAEIELEPFVIPVQGGAQGFLRLSVLLYTTKNADAVLERERQRLRLVIYNVLLNTPVENVSAEEKQEALCRDLKKLLNTVLGKEYILDVKFTRILVVEGSEGTERKQHAARIQ